MAKRQKKQIETLIKLPEIPENLNPDARMYFTVFGQILVDSGRFAPGDEKPLARLAHLYSISDRLEKEMNDAWSQQLIKQNLPTYDKVVKNILALETAFQMNPGARYRARIQQEQKEPEDPKAQKLRELMAGRK